MNGSWTDNSSYSEKISRKFETIPVTHLQSFIFCPRLLYRKAIFGMKTTNAALVLGQVRHTFHDLANKYEKNIIVHLPKWESTDEVVSTFSSAYINLLKMAIASHAGSIRTVGLNPKDVMEKINKPVVREAAEKAESIAEFGNQNKVFGEDLWERLPKAITELKVTSSKLRLQGTVDRVEVNNDAIQLVELKTGKAPRQGVWPSHRLQVAAYMMLLGEKFNKPVEKAIVRYLETDSKENVYLNPYLELEVTEATEKTIRMLQGDEEPKACQRKTCPCKVT